MSMKKESYLFRTNGDYVFFSEKNIKEMQISSLYNIVMSTMKERRDQLLKDANTKIDLKINNVDVVVEFTKSLDKVNELYPELIVSARNALSISLN